MGHGAAMREKLDACAIEQDPQRELAIDQGERDDGAERGQPAGPHGVENFLSAEIEAHLGGVLQGDFAIDIEQVVLDAGERVVAGRKRARFYIVRLRVELRDFGNRFDEDARAGRRNRGRPRE